MERSPIHTPMCDLLGIRHPIVQGALGGPWGPSVELAAAVCGAGGLGSLPMALQTGDRVREEVARLRDLTEASFALNLTMLPFDEEVFAAMLESRPAVISFALGFDAELIHRAHDAGSRFVQQVHSVPQAEAAAEAGADAIVAQGGEAGGFGGAPATIVLVPQVVDAVSPVPVIAAGGIADGRGVAAGLALGASGAQIGTRFLASEEIGLHPDYRDAVVRARSEDTLRAPFLTQLLPSFSRGGFDLAPRVIRTPFVQEWQGREDEVARERDRLTSKMRTAIDEGRAHELLAIAGESVGLIHDIRPAAEIVETAVKDAAAILGRR